MMIVMAVMSEFEVIKAENTHPNVPVTVSVSLTQWCQNLKY